MTIKSKTFYVGDKGMGDIKSDNNALMCLPTKDSTFKNEITISWKEERKAEVTESQIDELWKQWEKEKVYLNPIDYIKDRIFKGIK